MNRGRHAGDPFARHELNLVHAPAAGFRMLSRLCPSNTTSERMPCMRSCISWEKPAITALTTIIVATPSITLMIEASAI